MSESHSRWTSEEVEKLKELVDKKVRVTDMVEQLDREEAAIYNKLKQLKIKSKINRAWTEDEVNFLFENWGLISIKGISNKLNRTKCSIKKKAQDLKIGRARDNSIYVKLNDFIKDSGISRNRIYSMHARYKFPLIRRKLDKRIYYFIDLDSVLTWMEKNQDKFDGSKVSEDLFVNEPDWLKTKRKRDLKSKENINSRALTKQWNTEDTIKLKDLIEIGHSYEDIAQIFGVTSSQIKAKARKENLSYFGPRYWRGKQYKYIKEHWKTQSDSEIGKALGRSERAVSIQRTSFGLVKNKKMIYRQDEIDYLKHNLDKTDKEIGDHLGRSEASIYNMRKRFSLFKQGKKHKWTEEEKQYIIDNLNKEDKELAEHFGVSYDAIRNFRKRHGIKKKNKQN